MTTHKNNAKHQETYRQRRRTEGVAEVRGLWAPKELHEAIKAAVRLGWPREVK